MVEWNNNMYLYYEEHLLLKVINVKTLQWVKLTLPEIGLQLFQNVTDQMKTAPH